LGQKPPAGVRGKRSGPQAGFDFFLVWEPGGRVLKIFGALDTEQG